MAKTEGRNFMHILDQLGIDVPDNCRKVVITAQVDDVVTVDMELLMDLRDLKIENKRFALIELPT